MKKILLGLLIVGALSACSSSEEKEMDMPTQVQTLNETVATQTQEFEALKAEVEELKMQTEELKMGVQE
ncbi:MULTISPECIES: lipoprotein [Psychrilyobacter]|uniref:Lipoprotein n=1 Tax=Psychrilyobacter piezotolerans TaxID=2293438 RepID=A0ABX9KG61_9FUSO|nr:MULTISPECIES: hypothetical protein [Psychrilyobacter]MCS5421393.1 hypothetical protein [Psychrilyobacter sp. S5]NDI78479.1 hypothetical protein [Psychrilyobacter piezotolerans]RDE60664.1 hypothetical protein DV867_10555 [Psychrilyobacter sp. S5]REI40591.1 hypothetical protein DYH56_10555 [Psychrilyobacter piezotolerans]